MLLLLSVLTVRGAAGKVKHLTKMLLFLLSLSTVVGADASGSFVIKGVRLFGQAKEYSMHFGIPSLPCAFLVLIHHPSALAILLPLEQQRRRRRFSSMPSSRP